MFLNMWHSLAPLRHLPQISWLILYISERVPPAPSHPRHWRQPGARPGETETPLHWTAERNSEQVVLSLTETSISEQLCRQEWSPRRKTPFFSWCCTVTSHRGRRAKRIRLWEINKISLFKLKSIPFCTFKQQQQLSLLNAAHMKPFPRVVVGTQCKCHDVNTSGVSYRRDPVTFLRAGSGRVGKGDSFINSRTSTLWDVVVLGPL